MTKKKSRMPEIGEAIFCILYLSFGFIAAAVFLTHINGRTSVFFYGMLTLILAGGDSFHLVPRILHAFKGDFEKYEFWAGLGLMISSITMTSFYLILYYYWLEEFGGRISEPMILEPILFFCAVFRIVLCSSPKNNWFHKEGNPRWSLMRNIPFAVVGLVMIILFSYADQWGMVVAIFVSFLCYFPVVIWGKTHPKVGMLMMPKTIAYVAMIIMGFHLL